MKKLLASSLFAIFACFNAFALDWMNNGEDLSSANAQIICNGNDCTLSNINAGDITDRIDINGVHGLNSFIFADTNPNGDSTRINYNGFGYFALQFSGFQGNNIELNGEVLSKGKGINLQNSYLYNNFISAGNISATGKGAFALYLELSIIDGDFISSGNNISLMGQAIVLEKSIIYGDFISSGTNTADNNAFYLDGTTIHGDFVSSGTNNALNNTLVLNTSTIKGNFISSGANNSNHNNALNLNNSTINGDFISSGINYVKGQDALSLKTSVIGGDFISSGTNTAEDNAIVLTASTVNGDFISSGTNAASKSRAIRLLASTIKGDFVSSGNNIVYNGGDAIVIDGSTIKGDFISSGTNTVTNSRALYLDSSTVNGDFISSGNNNADQDALYLMASTVKGDFISSGTNTANNSRALYLYGATVKGDFISSSENYAENETLYLAGSTIHGDFISSGNNSASKEMALVLESSTVNGDFVSSGINTADYYAIFLELSDIYGNFISSGTNAALDNAIVLRASTVNGDFISSGNNNVDKNWALYLEGSTVNGNFISLGENIAASQSALHLSGSTINGDVISSGNNSATEKSIFLESVNIHGNVISSGTNTASNSFSLVAVNSTIYGDFISSGTNNAKSHLALGLTATTIHGDFISSGINTTGNINTIYFQAATINGDFISSGTNTAMKDYAIVLVASTVNGDFIHEGLTLAGTVNPDGTFNATGDQAMHFEYNTMLNKNFINSGTIASASEGIWMQQTRIAGDIINSGNILGGKTDFDNGYSGSEETAGLYIVNSALGGKIQNKQTGIISGGYGVTLSQDYKDGTAGTYASKNLHIINNGLIKGYNYDAIAFDITSSDDEHGGAGQSYNNILTYSGNGKLESKDFDIDMGAGDDVINFTDVRSKWFKINGAETININNYIVESNYTDDSTSMHTHTDNYTSVFNISKMGFLVNTDSNYTAGTDLYVMQNVGALTDDNLSNMTLVLDGYAQTDGYFFMDGSDLKYHLRSLGSIAAKSDQAVAISSIPSISAQASSIISAQGFNRSAMNLVSGRMMKLYGNIDDVDNQSFDTSGLWVQGFGEKSKYDGKIEHNTVQSVGYDSSRYGIVLGFDKQIGDNVLIGAALSYGTGEVQGELNQFNIDLKQYQLSLYGSYNMNNYFIDA
ncbi:MAG: hypothetical protein ACOX7D_03390, partial [Alphaproteobacteria bacterium]